MLPMSAPDCVLLLVVTSMWWMTCHGYIVLDAEADDDDMWPVLCPPNTFYSKTQDDCLACSQCPVNKIIITQCRGLHDTKCAPFYNLGDLISPTASLPGNRLNNHDNNYPASDIAHHTPSHGGSHLNSWKSTFQFTDSEWKLVTICLFVLLSFAVIVIFVVAVYLFRRKATHEKRLLCEYSPPTEDV